MANGERLRAFRETIGVTQGEFANTLGVAPSFISGIERNAKDVSRDLLERLLKRYEINVNWLLTGEGVMLRTAPHPLVEPGQEVVKSRGGGSKVPLLRQKVSCGPGVDWQDEANIVDYIDVFDLIPHLKIKRMFALCVEGSSMLGAGIRNGDYVLFDSAQDQWPHDGIYVFSLDGEVYCKRLEFDMEKIKIYSVRVVDLEKAELLRTLNTEDVDFSDRFRIFGRVLYWVHPNLE